MDATVTDPGYAYVSTAIKSEGAGNWQSVSGTTANVVYTVL